MSTETHDPRFREIDAWPTRAAVAAMFEGQLAAISALHGQLDAIADAADAAAERMQAGGRLVYVGAGTSGRIAVQDGVELTPTFDWPPERLVFLLAGGMTALASAVEGAEDGADQARKTMADAKVGPNDVVIGIAASGNTKFTVAAVEYGRNQGALTIGVANNPGTSLLAAAEHSILVDTGSEAIAGSTRMKAGTAQKAVLNLLSTAIMLRCGFVYNGLMVNMRISNEKLARRANIIVRELSGVSREEADAALRKSGNEVRSAILIAQGIAPERAKALLSETHQNLRLAIAASHE